MEKEYGVLCFRSAQLLYIVAYQWKGFYHSLDWFDFIYRSIDKVSDRVRYKGKYYIPI